MAAYEIWDYLSATPVTPDYNATLSVTPRRVLVEDGRKNQIVNRGDDESEEIISLSDDSVFHVELQWPNITEADAGTIFDWYHDTAKANGKKRSFKWTNSFEVADPHTYTVRFDSPLQRKRIVPNEHDITSVRFKVLGRAPT